MVEKSGGSQTKEIKGYKKSKSPGRPKKTTKKMSKTELEETLIQNFTNLQKVMTNLSGKFDELSSNISKLLQLFEISAKSFSEKSESGFKDDKLHEKVNNLAEQNKTIAKGIMLIEEKIRGNQKTNQPPKKPPQNMPQRPSPRFRNFRTKPLPKG